MDTALKAYASTTTYTSAIQVLRLVEYKPVVKL